MSFHASLERGFKHSLILAVMGVSACGTSAGVKEFELYAEAFASVADASDVVLNEIAAEERLMRRHAMDAKSPFGISHNFKRVDISTFAPSADPKLVASLRLAIDSVVAMNAVLLAYAQGRPLDLLKEELADLETIAADASKLAALGEGVTAVEAALKPIEAPLKVLASVGSREAFRTELIKSAQIIHAVLDAVLDNSTAAFTALTQSEFKALREGGSGQDTVKQDIATEREMLAEWLHLIELSQVALTQATAAVGQPSRDETDLINAARITGELGARVERIKRLSAMN